MITVQNLCFSYPGSETKAIDQLNFDISRGEIFGFLGPSGAGKSTTQKILIGLLKKYEGLVHINGFKSPACSSAFFQNIGVGFELPNHYSRLTALENLNFFKSFYDKECEDPMALLEMVGLKDNANQKVGEFSKGMRMRLNFIRAMLHKPDILFLDEPTSGLDPLNARILKNIILKFKEQGKTVFLTTHNMHDADELCDRVAFMAGGKLVLIDSPWNLKQKYARRSLQVEYENNGIHSLEFPMDGLGANQDFLNLINTHYIRSLHSKEASLEDIFIQTTGHKLVQ